MNTFLVCRYVRYFIYSRHGKGHGIHSPFVYSLINDVFKNKTERYIVSMVEKSRKAFRSDQRVISVTDMGSGSLKIKGEQRRVRDIARYASVRPAYGRLISRLASLIDGKYIIELGTSLGLGTMYLALGAPRSRVFTIEGCSNIAGIAEQNFRTKGLDNIEVIRAGFDDVLENILRKEGSPGLVYIDGNHTSEALIRYMDILEPFINEDTIVLIDDIHYSKDMERGWEFVKQMGPVVLSIDILQMGLLFYRKGIKKQNFIIRY